MYILVEAFPNTPLMMKASTHLLRFMMTKGLLLGSGLIAWALWRMIWEGELWSEVVGVGLLICWLVLVWLTTISRHLRLFGTLTLKRCLFLGAGMSVSALLIFSGFLWIQQGPLFAEPATSLDLGTSLQLSEASQTVVGITTILLTLLVGALYWKSGKWDGPDQVDF